MTVFVLALMMGLGWSSVLRWLHGDDGWGAEPNPLVGRDSGNDFRIPEIGLDNFRFLFILFLYPHAVPLNDCRFLELTFVSGAD